MLPVPRIINIGDAVNVASVDVASFICVATVARDSARCHGRYQVPLSEGSRE